MRCSMLVGAVLTLALISCADDDGDGDGEWDGSFRDGGPQDGGAGLDGGRDDAGIDGGGGPDAMADAQVEDASAADGGATDASTLDAGADGGVAADASVESDAAGEDAGDDGAAPESFATIYTAILAPSCTGCHGAGHRSGLDLSTEAAAYASLYDVAAATGASNSDCEGSALKRVEPGDAEASLLVQKVEPDPPCGQRMPRGGASLSEEQIARIRSWVEGGAPR